MERYLVLFQLFAFAYCNNVGVLILGSHIDSILENRVNELIKTIHRSELNDYTIFCSGGVKYDNLKGVKTEADKMIEIINKKLPSEKNYKIVKDDKSTKTAENLLNFKEYCNSLKFDNVILVTSNFHFNRADKMWKHINSRNIDTIWILESNSLEKFPWLMKEEEIHIKNYLRDLDDL
tara:strand:- start:1189 stop:1722 length:534 start_codon:yes stop_codon:yes gene_type:complete